MLLQVKVKPGAPKNKILNYKKPNFLEIAIEAKPEKNEANICLCKFLAKCLQINLERIKILKGKSSPKKILIIEDVEETEFWSKILK
ncbi:MAG: DUF167 domain-containing protein [Caldimicrobium sp.]